MGALLKIALAQVQAAHEPAANLIKAAEFARRAADRGSGLIVFPEMFMALPTPKRPPALIAMEDGGAFARGLTDLAVETGLFLMSGCWEVGPDRRRAYNTARVISPAGETVATYRKLHLFEALNLCEPETTVPGDTLPPVVEISGVQVGLAICYDLRFPELFRHLAMQGAELVVLPSAWYQGPMKETHWKTLMRARSIENTFYMAGCDLVGPAFCGCSAVFDPFGVLLSGAGETETLLEAVVDTERIHEVRCKLPSLSQRRRDLLF